MSTKLFLKKKKCNFIKIYDEVGLSISTVYDIGILYTESNTCEYVYPTSFNTIDN